MTVYPDIPTFPLINGEILIFAGFLRQEVQKGDSEQPITRWDLNRALEAAIERYLSGERL